MNDRQITICEVGPRDGLQNQAKQLSVVERATLVRKLTDAGVNEIEVGSFVSPKAVPQMANSDQVLAATNDLTARQLMLIPNWRGYEMALAAGCRTVSMVLYGTDTMAQKNARTTRDGALQALAEIAAAAREQGVEVIATMGVAFECPFEGPVAAELVESVCARALQAGASTVVLADTIGAANPAMVETLMTRLVSRFGAQRLGCHFHDTRAMGLANVYAALRAGIRRFDASVAGLGGCPFAPGAGGNVATEDVVMMLGQMGFETGIDMEKLLLASAYAAEVTGAAPGGRASIWLQRWCDRQRKDQLPTQ